MTIDIYAKSIWQKITGPVKAAFFACLVSGLITHLYAFTNMIPNSDGIERMYDTQQMTVSGRWFLHFASVINDYTQMPMVIGVLSVVFLSLAAAFTVSALSLKSNVYSVVCGILMGIFPSLSYTFLYMFTAAAYCLAILFAAASVCFAQKSGKGIIISAVLLALSMGIYQAYCAFAISLSLLVLLRKLINDGSTIKSFILCAKDHVLSLAAGGGLYYIILKIFLKAKNLELLSYLGMNEVGSFSGGILSSIGQSYKDVWNFFFSKNSDGFTNGLMIFLTAIALLGSLALIIVTLAKKKEGWRVIFVIILVALLPAGINFLRIINPSCVLTPVIAYSFVCVYLLPLTLADEVGSIKKASAVAAACWVLLMAIFCLNTNNLVYTASDQTHRATESYMTRMLTRIEETDGYYMGMDIVIVGYIPYSEIYADVESYSQIAHYSVPLYTVTDLNKQFYYYLNDWLNYPAEEPTEEVFVSICETEEFKAMPLYPQSGSVKIINGKIVVKLA